MPETRGATAAAWTGCWMPGVSDAYMEEWPERSSATKAMQTQLALPPTVVYHPWKCTKEQSGRAASVCDVYTGI